MYQKISRQTKNRLQEIFDVINFDFDKLCSVADNKTKQKINTYIEEWKDKGLLSGYFGVLAKKIYSRTRVKNCEILELLIYSAYMEEQSKVEKSELNIFKSLANFYYQQGQEEVNQILSQKRKVCVIPDAVFLSLLDMPNSKGYVWKQYVEATIKYNAEQIYRQCVINIQQNKENQIEDAIFQNLIKKQQNAKLCINGDKISGDVDLTLIGLNNQAKMQGIYCFDEKAKCKFISIEDEATTKECQSLNRQEFFLDDWNEFYRYSKTNGSLVKYRCYGLVVGLNLPPINDGFHWCRSTITYLPTIAKQEEKEYNLNIPRISKDIEPLIKNTKLNKKVKKLFNRYLTDDNLSIDNTASKPMYYNIDKDKIIINPTHKDFKSYDIRESLTHEIIHLIDKRNNISDKLKMENDLRRTENYIVSNSQKYIDMFKDKEYFENMTLGDIFSSLTYDNIAGRYGHDYDYWYDINNVKSELSANIMSAYLNDNTKTLDVIGEITSLNNIKEEVIRKYEKYIK